MSRRIVLHRTTGPLTGIYQIHGHVDDNVVLPSQLNNVTYEDGRLGVAMLEKTEQRYALYREAQ